MMKSVEKSLETRAKQGMRATPEAAHHPDPPDHVRLVVVVSDHLRRRWSVAVR